MAILEQKFADRDIWFLNHQARLFLMDADPKHTACYHHQLGLIRELFALVPERLQNKLTWRGPDDSTRQ